MGYHELKEGSITKTVYIQISNANYSAQKHQRTSTKQELCYKLIIYQDMDRVNMEDME